MRGIRLPTGMPSGKEFERLPEGWEEAIPVSLIKSNEIRLVDDIIPSVRTKPQKHESTTLIRNTCSRPAQRCNPMSLESWDLAGRPNRSREDCGKRSTKGYDHRKSTSTMSPFTSTSMMSRRVSCACGRSSRGAIANDGAGWAEKPAGENPKPSVHSGAARRREQPSRLRALGRRYGCWRPAQNRCSYGGRAGLPSALCPSGAPHSGERNLSGPALYLWEPSQTGAPINNIGQWE